MENPFTKDVLDGARMDIQNSLNTVLLFSLIERQIEDYPNFRMKVNDILDRTLENHKFKMKIASKDWNDEEILDLINKQAENWTKTYKDLFNKKRET